MKDAQPKAGLEGIVVTIIVEQLMIRFNAEGSNDAVDRLAYSHTSVPQHPVVPCGGNSKLGIEILKDRKLRQVALQPAELRLAANTPQDLAEDKAGESDFPFANSRIQPIGLGIDDTE